jgi:hypothetical protein
VVSNVQAKSAPTNTALAGRQIIVLYLGVVPIDIGDGCAA